MRRLVVVLLVLAAAAGCASVPAESPVQILRRVSDGETAAPAPGPVDGSDPIELVRGFVNASASSADRHGAARQFLAPEAVGWDDAAGFTVIETLFDTVPVIVAGGGPGADRAVVRVRGTAIGRITPAGSFEPDQAPVQLDIPVLRRDGQWQIVDPPPGVLVPLAEFRQAYRAVAIWMVDPARRLVVPDLRYLPAYPARAQAARALELLLAGPSAALQGAATSQLVPGSQLRSNIGNSGDGAVVVDLTGVGDLDETARRLIAAQVVHTLAEVNVARVQILVDGVALLPAMRADLTRGDFADLSAEVQPGADVPGLFVAGGRLRALSGPDASAPLPGAVGDGTYDVESAATTVDGQRLAVVARAEGRRLLLVGGSAEGGVLAAGVEALGMTRPSWTPSGSEVWTVLDSAFVARVLLDGAGPARTGQVNADELAAFGPITDLRLSRDGMRVVAVVGGGLYTGAVARTVDGEVAIRNIDRLRAADLGEVVAADWRSTDTVVAITRRPDQLVVQVSVNGLLAQPVLVNNLTPPLSAVSAAPSRPTLVTDQGGIWSFAGGEQDAWRQVLGGFPDAIPFYPG